MSQLLTDEFEDFFQKIQLSKTQQERIESAIDALSGFLIKQYELDIDDVFVQGSFSTGTVVKPAPSLGDDAEYDVDIVVFCASSEMSPDEALNDLEETIASNGNYKDKIETKNRKIPCVRLRYADEPKARFHVDVVPARPSDDGTIEVPRRNDGWESSDPAAYTDWVTSKGERYRRTLMMLKRWRDECKAPIKSIVLQVITSECLSDSEDDSINLAETMQAVSDLLDSDTSPPEINNPVFEEEIITSSWSDADFTKFKELIADAADVASAALSEQDHDEAATLWQKILGEGFVFRTDKEVSIRLTEANLGDTSHAQPLTFPYQSTQGVTVNIKAFFYNPWTKRVYMPRKRRHVEVAIVQRRREIKSGQLVKSGGHLDYFAQVRGLRGKQYEIYWQVVNTGDEARDKNGLRGTFFESKDTNNLKYNYEQTSYEGAHWIECFVVHNGICVARSGRFYINIYH